MRELTSRARQWQNCTRRSRRTAGSQLKKLPESAICASRTGPSARLAVPRRRRPSEPICVIDAMVPWRSDVVRVVPRHGSIRFMMILISLDATSSSGGCVMDAVSAPQSPMDVAWSRTKVQGDCADVGANSLPAPRYRHALANLTNCVTDSRSGFESSFES